MPSAGGTGDRSGSRAGVRRAFSHDDRLPAAVRRLATGARVIEVTRCAGSVVFAADACDPAQRDLDDAHALAWDRYVDPAILRRVLPGLCRSAVVTAARDAWFAHAQCSGIERRRVEETWAAANTQGKRLALALHGDADRSVDGWRNKTSYRRAAIDVIGRAVHDGVARDPKGAVRTRAASHLARQALEDIVRDRCTLFVLVRQAIGEPSG